MTIPASGAFTSEAIRAEWGGSYPMTSATVAAWAGLAPPWSSDGLRGKSASTLSITVGARTQTRVGGTASTMFRAARTLTPVYSGFTAASYSWSHTSTQGVAGLTTTTGATSQIWLTYDIEEGDIYYDDGTVYLTIVDTAGASHSTSVNWSL